MWMYNALLTVYRGESTDVYGNKVANNITPSASGIPASVLSTTKNTDKIGGYRPREVTMKSGIVHVPISVSIGDRVKDTVTNTLYFVDEIYLQESPEFLDQTMLTLRQVETAD